MGKFCIDLTVVGTTDANVTIGGTGVGNAFLNCGTGSIRVSKDAAGASEIDVVIDDNVFRVTDHSSTLGTSGNFPQGGVLLRAGPGELLRQT